MYALLPTAIGLTWAAGVLALAGVELDLFAVFAVVTFVGIGVDYGIHLVHRYHARGDAEHATAELAPVILSAAAITLGGYGTLDLVVLSAACGRSASCRRRARWRSRQPRCSSCPRCS